MPNPTTPLSLNSRGAPVKTLHANLRKVGYVIPNHELDEQVFGVGTRSALLKFQAGYKLSRSGVLDDRTKAALEKAVAVAGTDKYRVEGRIFFDYGLPASGVTVRLYNRDFGGTETQLGESTSDEQGFYALSYDPGGKAPNLEVRVVHGHGKEILLSATKFNAERHLVLNLVVPASVRPLEPEYQRLTADLEKQLGELSKLADARENAKRHDLTLLHQATGWDARLIALTATAFKVSTDTGISPDALYALFRVGLPSNKQRLAQLSVEAVEKALRKANQVGIVSLDDKQLAGAKTALEKFSREDRQAEKAPGALSSFGELMAQSGLDDGEQRIFEDLYFIYRGAPEELWKKAREQGIPDEKINGLKLQGKLEYLTLNNAVLTASLQQEIGSPDNLGWLVDNDLYRKDEWETRLKAAAGGDGDEALQKLIPSAYTGETAASRLSAYTADLARKVRRSFPTQVVRRMIETNELDLDNGHNALRENIATVLKNAGVLGFELGRKPVNAFIRDHRDKVLQGINQDIEATIQGVKRLARLYQITPSDEALKVVYALGFTSAYDVTAFPFDVFLDRFGRRFPSLEEAKLVYRKAQQVNAVTFNLVVMAKQLANASPVYAIFPPHHSPPESGADEAKANLIEHYPTMESLFRSVDFCECEHCRSVLSPAAYFVDLLQFLDPDEQVWNSPDPTPYAVLTERRPELPHLPLTCENTHTALPYIDVVNEILEYYVANERLTADAVHDTGEATTPELLAEPHNIIPAAYDTLKIASYPLSLPFDLWLETVRQFLDHFGTPLWQVLEVFRPADEPFAPLANPASYYRAQIFAEYLGLSPAEYAIFTDVDPLGNGNWYVLYGLPTVRPAIHNPTNIEPATLTVANADAKKFREGLSCTYFDAGANAVSAESKIISSVGAPHSGGDGQTIITFMGVWAAPPDAGDLLVCNAPATLKSAKTLSRRLGVTYKEIVQIVQAGFVNPELAKLGILYKLGVNIHDARFFLDNKTLLLQDVATLSPEDQKRRLEVEAFAQRLTTIADRFSVPVAQLEAELQTIPFDRVLVLADPDAGCNFDLTTLRYANGDPADAVAFLKINLFVRLWKKLGWTIEETDRALQIFLPSSALQWTVDARQTALLYMAHLKALDERLEVGKNSRLKLLSLWANLSTTGKNSLYAQLFLTPSVLKNDPIFDDPLGNYLSQPDIGIRPRPNYPDDRDHLLALQGALGLTADEIGRILDNVGEDLATAELSLDNVSRLYRYGLLAKALKLSVSDLNSLKALSGLDPFKPLNANPVATLADDYPFSQTLRFVEVAETIKESGFKVEDLDYLLRHRFDPVGKYRPNPDALLELVKLLAAGIRQVQSEHAVPAMPASLTDDQLRQKLGLVLPADVVETFFGMWTGTKEYEAIRDVEPDGKLDPAAFAQEPAIRVSYDEVRHVQLLSFRGVLLDAKKAHLTDDNPSPVLANLLDAVQSQAKAFFNGNFVSLESPFLAEQDFEALFGLDLTDAAKREKLAQAFLPRLQQRLIRQLVVQALAPSLNADPTLIEALLINATLLSDPYRADTPLINLFAAAGEQGLSVAFFASTDGTGALLNDWNMPQATVDTTTKPAAANSARFEGYLEVPADGAYRFFVVFEGEDAEAELRFAHLPGPFLEGTAANGGETSNVIELKPGVPYRFTFEAHNLERGDVKLLVQGEKLPKGNLNRLTLYPEATVESVRRAQALLAKTSQLVQGFGLTEREVRYLVTPAAGFENLNFSQLPTHEADDEPDRATALFGQFLRLASYARLKRDLAGGTDDLVGVFEIGRGANSDAADLCQRLADLTRRSPLTVQAAAAHFGFIESNDNGELRVNDPTGFTHENGIRRLWEALQVAEKLGVPVEVIAGWTGIVSSAKTSEERFAISRDLKDTVKARYEPGTWQSIARPMFDKLRQRQRDALVAYVMHNHPEGFESANQLFEYFLIDPGMEPVVQTSRLRLAISSVQLFIQRCLLNLEPKVRPSAINSKQWQWMKHYRVWEANRKIFLFPENRLEPEFRDDKTHLFQELESALLQGDVSNDLVEDAFFNYLKKLEHLAQLEIVAMYCEEKPDPAYNILHVIGRTSNEPHKYFYRRYAQQMWTPWEPVTADIEGDHIVAVVWRERLHLFWVTFLEKATQASNGQQSLDFGQDATAGEIANEVSSKTPAKEVEVQLNWSEYFQGQWTPRESSGFDKPIRVTVDSDFDRNKVFIHVSKENDEDGNERAVEIHLSDKYWEFADLKNLEIGTIETLLGSNPQLFVLTRTAHGETTKWVSNTAFRLVSKNSQPEIVPRDRDWQQGLPYSPSGVQATRRTDSDDLTVTYEGDTKDILQKGEKDFTLLFSSMPPAESEWLLSPFFYQDNQHTFFVEPNLTESTILDFEGWGVIGVEPDPNWNFDDRWDRIPAQNEVPIIEPSLVDDPQDPRWVDPGAFYRVQPQEDWVTDPATVLQFDEGFIGQGGALDADEFASGRGLNVIGGDGLNSGLLKNVRRGMTGDRQIDGPFIR